MSEQLARAVVAQEVAAIRAKLVAQSLEAFCRVYLKSRFTPPFAPMHHDLCEELEWLRMERGVRLAVAMPPTHGKTALLTIGHALWRVCAHKEAHIVIVCPDEETTLETITEFGIELGGNEALLRAFSFAAAKNRGGGNEIITRGGQRIAAVTVGERLLGRRRVGPAPALLICDDVEQWETREWGSSRKGVRPGDFKKWLEAAIAQRLAPEGAALVVGSIPANDSYLADLVDPDEEPGWQKRAYRAMEWSAWNDNTLWRRFVNVYRGHAADEGFGSGEDGAGKFYEAHKEELEAVAGVEWPARYSALDLLIRSHQMGVRRSWREDVFLARYLSEPITRLPPEHARQAGGVPPAETWSDGRGHEFTRCGDEYDERVFMRFESAEPSPDVSYALVYPLDHTPDPKGTKAPPFLLLGTRASTGEKGVVPTFGNRRRIHAAWAVGAFWDFVRSQKTF